jgi:pteridine reductase
MSDPRPVALVTGSGKRRVGWHVAEALARRGHDLVVHYNHSAAEAERSAEHFRSLGVEAITAQAELADEAAVRGLVQAGLDRFGRLDVLANCAAIWERKRLEDVTAQDVRRHFEANTLGTFLCCQHAGLAMVKQPQGGLIVNVGDWAIARPYRDYAAYFPSKAAIPGLTRCFAAELGTRNPKVRVNAVLPGPVMLPPDLPEAERRHSINATLVKREGSPEHIAKAVLFFLDNDFVTGACVPVDGGRTVFAAEEWQVIGGG